MDILEEIVALSKKKLSRRKSKVSVSQLEQSTAYNKNRRSLKEAILRNSPKSIIAEIKFCSPSKGIIRSIFDVENIAQGYQKFGATGISVLTEEDYFCGKKQYLTSVKNATALPVLCKDFIINEYQIVEARSIGADAILLIAAILSFRQIVQFTKLAHDLELEVLLEVHCAQELDDLFYEEADIIGVNNRNLKTLQVSINNSLELVAKIPKEAIKISESGLTANNIHKLINVGFNGFLIGETFMKESIPAVALKILIESL